MATLTNRDIERQDFVDNTIYELINLINPSVKNIEWDIEIIGEVRDTLNYILTKKLATCSEQEFYPYADVS